MFTMPNCYRQTKEIKFVILVKISVHFKYFNNCDHEYMYINNLLYHECSFGNNVTFSNKFLTKNANK